MEPKTEPVTPGQNPEANTAGVASAPAPKNAEQLTTAPTAEQTQGEAKTPMPPPLAPQIPTAPSEKAAPASKNQYLPLHWQQ